MLGPNRFLPLIVASLVVSVACAAPPKKTVQRASANQTQAAPSTPLAPSEEKQLAAGLFAQHAQKAARPDARTAALLGRLQSLYGTPTGTTDASRAYAFAVYATQLRRIVSTHQPTLLADLESLTGPLPPDMPLDDARVFTKNALVAYGARAGTAERLVVEIAVGYAEDKLVSAPEQAARWCRVEQRQALHNLTQIVNAQSARRARNAPAEDLTGLGLDAINRGGAYTYVVEKKHGGYLAEATGRPGTRVAGDIWRATLTMPVTNTHNACPTALDDAEIAIRVDKHIVNELSTLGDPQNADTALALFRCHRRQDDALHLLSVMATQLKAFRRRNNDWPNTQQMQDLVKSARSAAPTTLYRLEHWDAGRPTEHWRAVGTDESSMRVDAWSLNKIGKITNPQNVCGQNRSD